MAHFLEHLVFKGGEKYPTYRDVNEAAERNGSVLNAYTSHDLVAFHITARATRGLEAADLLTDFVARPRHRPDELDRERGVVVQEIARAARSAVDARRAPDRRGRVRRRTRWDGRCSAPPSISARPSRGTGSSRFAHADGRRPGAARLRSATLTQLGSDSGSWTSLFERFPAYPEPTPFEPAPPQSPRLLVTERDSNQSHLRMSYRPSIDVHDPPPACRADDLLDAARRLHGFASVRRDPGAARPRLFGQRLSARVCRRRRPPAQRRPGERQVPGGVPPDAGHRQRTAQRRADRGGGGPRQGVCGRRSHDLVREQRSCRSVRRAADDRLRRGRQPGRARSPAWTRSPTTRWRTLRAGSPTSLSVACVGPHTVQELESA